MSLQQPFADAPEPVETVPVPADEIEDGVLYEEQVAPEYGVLGMTLRELLIVGVWVVAFALSFLPLVPGGSSAWARGLDWILPVGLPTVAVFLIVLRRFSPDGIRRVGSLGIDQFASVVFSFAALSWLQLSWSLVASFLASGTGFAWLPLVELLAAAALVVFTVFAWLVPGLREDFRGRLETLAHRNANPVRPVIPRPVTSSADPTSIEQRDASDEGTKQADVQDATEPDLAEQVPLTAHASRGDLGASSPEEDGYAPAYARRSRRRSETGELNVVPAALGAAGAEPVVAEAVAFEPVAVDGSFPSVSSGAESDHRADERSQVAPEEQVASDEQVAPEELVEPGDSGPTELPSLFADLIAAQHQADAPETPDEVDSEVREQTETVATSESTSSPSEAEAGDVADPAANDVDAANPRMPQAAQPFWALAPSERPVVDEKGEQIFTIGPSAWALVIEDRGGAFVVRHDDGRIGYLHDIADITKG